MTHRRSTCALLLVCTAVLCIPAGFITLGAGFFLAFVPLFAAIVIASKPR